MSWSRLPPAVQALHAELLQLALTDAAMRTALGLRGGTIVSKEIKGRRYLYLQRTWGGRNHQHYLGPESAELGAWVGRLEAARDGLSADRRRQQELCAMLAAGGAWRESAAVIRVLEILAEGGFFGQGGVLVGTVAFAAQATMLGIRLPEHMARTEDVDAAHDRSLALALVPDPPASDLGKALVDSPLGFLPVPELDPRQPSTSFKVRGRQLRVDFLTPARGRRAASAPVPLPYFGVAAQPLPFLDYLIEGAVQTVAIGPSAVLLNVPDPARSAWHKLWTVGQRPVSQATKANKDLMQATALFEVLLEDRPGDLLIAWRALAARETRRREVERGLARLPGDLLRRVDETVGGIA